MRPLIASIILATLVLTIVSSEVSYAQVKLEYLTPLSEEDYFSQINNRQSANQEAEYAYLNSSASSSIAELTNEESEAQFYDARQNPDYIFTEYDVNLITSVDDEDDIDYYRSAGSVHSDATPETNKSSFNGNSLYYNNTYPSGNYYANPFYGSNYAAFAYRQDPFNTFFSPFYSSIDLGLGLFSSLYFASSYPLYWGSFYGDPYNSLYYYPTAAYYYSPYYNNGRDHRYTSSEIQNQNNGISYEGQTRPISSISYYANSEDTKILRRKKGIVADDNILIDDNGQKRIVSEKSRGISPPDVVKSERKNLGNSGYSKQNKAELLNIIRKTNFTTNQVYNSGTFSPRENTNTRKSSRHNSYRQKSSNGNIIRSRSSHNNSSNQTKNNRYSSPSRQRTNSSYNYPSPKTYSPSRSSNPGRSRSFSPPRTSQRSAPRPSMKSSSTRKKN